ncbi:MAG: EAL domain-containing protein [Janthinobacterium lividum]
MMEPPATRPGIAEGPPQRRISNNERFVAFAFAAADLVVEVESDGRITYAAGAFQTRLGQQPEAFIGRPVQELVNITDHVMLDSALSLLLEKGRLMPVIVRMADARKTELALAGLMLTANGPARLCLSFAVPPLSRPADHVETPRAFLRVAKMRLWSGASAEVGLLDVKINDAHLPAGLEISSTLQTLLPDVITSELTPTRFGLLGAGSSTIDLVAVAASLEGALQARGVQAAVASQQLSFDSEGLTPTQAARALRHALNSFASNGTIEGPDGTPTGSLADYMRQAATHTGALRRAIQELRFDLAFQPIVHLHDRRLHHYEALLRPRPIADCPVHTPQDFVSLAEALGLSDELDLAVAGLASLAAAASSIPIAFNVSGQSVQSPAFRDRLHALLAPSRACRTGRLIVEMTETAHVENVTEAAQTSRMLRSIGIPFCLDDFGAGSADVRILRGVPAEIVKLDGSYIGGITQNGRDRAFVAGMVDMAIAAGATVVAERIEVEAEAEVLSLLGVTYGQGWLFGRPEPLPELWPKLEAR